VTPATRRFTIARRRSSTLLASAAWPPIFQELAGLARSTVSPPPTAAVLPAHSSRSHQRLADLVRDRGRHRAYGVDAGEVRKALAGLGGLHRGLARALLGAALGKRAD
jgi:hypothetical protein